MLGRQRWQQGEAIELQLKENGGAGGGGGKWWVSEYILKIE